MMSTIYTQTERVLVWLGVMDVEFEAFLNQIAEWAKIISV
jgi:hypothetical protein